MNNDAPRKCAAGRKPSSCARLILPFSFSLACLGLPASAALGGTASDPLTAIADAPREAGQPVDPRGPDVQLLGVEPAPGGRWVALRAARQRPYELALWFVDLESGEFRAWEEAEPTTAPMVWEAGELRTEVRHSGRRQVVSIDPETGAFERIGREDAFDVDWARAVVTRRAGGSRVLSLEWAGREEVFELPGGRQTEYRVTRAPGLVFYSEPDHGAVRVLLHDMRSGATSEVATVGGLEPRWTPSPDGVLVAVTDDYRTHLVRAADGETVSGPWPVGRATWLEPDGHANVLFVSGGHRQVLEVYTGRRIQLGPELGPEPEVRVLPDGGFLLRSAGRLDQLDSEGELVENLVPGATRV